MLRLIGSHYHFRRAVPQAVQACLGRTEISLSLQTQSKFIARERAAALYAAKGTLFERARMCTGLFVRHPPSQNGPVIRTMEEARLRRLLLNTLYNGQTILDQEVPALKYPLPDKNVVLARWRKDLHPYEKRLRQAYHHYSSTKKGSEEANKSVWQRLNEKHKRLKKQFDQSALDFLEELRFAIQGLLYVVGLSITPTCQGTPPSRYILVSVSARRQAIFC